ncbi:hypothetical protein FQN60_010707, partial [Etheostoma spectabile]
MNIFTKVPGLAQQTSKLGSVLQRAFYGSSGRKKLIIDEHLSGKTRSSIPADSVVFGLDLQVTLFEQRNFAGRRLDLSSDCARLSDKNFPERCNSVQVESGAWVGYEHENFRGRQYLWDMSERGEYNCYDKWCAQDNNPGRAQLFERAGFSGKKMEIQDDIPNLMSRYSLNRVASIRVLGGAWAVYQEPNYRGPHYILEKKDYNNYSDWGSQNSTVGSMRR